MSTWLFIDCFLLILIIWWIYDLLKGEFLTNKLGAKASLGWLIGILITTIIVIIITFPLVKNTYEIKTFIRGSRLNQYISSYKLSAYLTQHHIEVRKIGEPSLLRFMASNGMYTDINVDVGADELIISILDSEFSII